MRFILIFVIAFLIITILKKFIKSRDDKKIQYSENDTLDEKYNADKKNAKIEIDTILEKVSEKGIHSLTIKEREKLDDYSGRD